MAKKTASGTGPGLGKLVGAQIVQNSKGDQRQQYRKANPVGEVPAKQIGHEMLPSRHALSTITGGDSFQRSINNYAKNTPVDANGVGSMGLSILNTKS